MNKEYRFNHIPEVVLRNIRFIRDNNIDIGTGDDVLECMMDINPVVRTKIYDDYEFAKDVAERRFGSTIEKLDLRTVLQKCITRPYNSILNNIYFRYFNSELIDDLFKLGQSSKVLDLAIKYECEYYTVNAAKTNIRRYNTDAYYNKFAADSNIISSHRSLHDPQVNAVKSAKFTYDLLMASRAEEFNPEIVREIFVKYGLKPNSSRNLYNRINDNLNLFYYIEDYLEEYREEGKFIYGTKEYKILKELRSLPLMVVLTQLTRKNDSGYILNSNLELVKG